MSTTTRMIALPTPLLQEASRSAAKLGVSTEQWIEVAVAEKLRLEEFFRVRAARATGCGLREALDKAGNNPPDPGDELED